MAQAAPIAEYVTAAVSDVAAGKHDLRMRRQDVPALQEGFLRNLPVRTDDLDDVCLFIAVLQLYLGIVVEHVLPDIVFERDSVGIGIYEHETAPGGDLRAGQLVD